MHIKIAPKGWPGWVLPASVCLPILFAMMAARSGVGQTNLGLTASLSNNALRISITNAISNASYDLFGVLEFKGTGAVQWSLIQTGAPGQQTFTVPLTPAL